MSLTLSAASVLPLAGAANAALMSIAIGAQALARRSPAGLYGAGFLASGALAALVITLGHAGAGPNWIFALVEGGITLAASLLFVAFIAALVGQAAPLALLSLPLAIFLAAALINPSITLHNASIERLAMVQFAYTAFAGWLVIGAARPETRLLSRRRLIAIAALAVMGAIHVAQLIRASSDMVVLRDIVPYVLAFVFFAMAGAVYFGARAAALEPVMTVREAPPEATALAARAGAALADPLLLRAADLNVAGLAARLGAEPAAVASALRTVHGETFREWLVRRRVAEAERLLCDPEESRTSVEAIGLLAGFRSRSAFYQAFRALKGVSPAAFREQSRPET